MSANVVDLTNIPCVESRPRLEQRGYALLAIIFGARFEICVPFKPPLENCRRVFEGHFPIGDGGLIVRLLAFLLFQTSQPKLGDGNPVDLRDVRISLPWTRIPAKYVRDGT